MGLSLDPASMLQKKGSDCATLKDPGQDNPGYVHDLALQDPISKRYRIDETRY